MLVKCIRIMFLFQWEWVDQICIFLRFSIPERCLRDRRHIGEGIPNQEVKYDHFVPIRSLKNTRVNRGIIIYPLTMTLLINYQKIILLSHMQLIIHNLIIGVSDVKAMYYLCAECQNNNYVNVNMIYWLSSINSLYFR